MKRGYKKLLIFDIILITLLFINSFSLNLLSRYKMVIFLIITILVFRKLFGFEKNRHRYVKDITLDIAILLFVFFIIYYLFGILVGFTVPNYYSIEGMINFIIPIILYVILREIFRYMIMCKTEGNKLVTIITVFMFILLDITSLIYILDFTNRLQLFKFIALSLLPAINTNIVLSYSTKKVGYKPLIFYALITELYRFLLPLVPNPSEYIVSIVDFILPILLGWRIYIFSKKERDEDLERDYHKKHPMVFIITALITTVLVYLTSGYFHYYAVAIASGSMDPKIKKGDIVIIEKLDKKYDKLKKGQVIAYKKDNRIIVHRLVDIIKDKNEYYFYTKGDANNYIDNFVIKEDMIIGTVDNKIQNLGWPTVWLSEL